jgi:protein TonB
VRSFVEHRMALFRSSLALFATAAVTLSTAAGAAGEEPDAVPRAATVEERLSEIRNQVQAQVEYPAIARERGTSGRSVVSFELAPDGTPQRLETLTSSGSIALDRAALRAVEAAAPFPWLYGRVEVPVDFVLREAPPGVSAR